MPTCTIGCRLGCSSSTKWELRIRIKVKAGSLLLWLQGCRCSATPCIDLWTSTLVIALPRLSLWMQDCVLFPMLCRFFGSWCYLLTFCSLLVAMTMMMNLILVYELVCFWNWPLCSGLEVAVLLFSLLKFLPCQLFLFLLTVEYLYFFDTNCWLSKCLEASSNSIVY